ncbi:hypothetical protein BU25DRAFT_234791 [Macroventuria anomochaeta]|uniref:Uncharacterized protein n=1 Tax=Macroventuria anomochaeta TaxID=301207 RepID=A0ACB6RIS5_9PLEO|nr:uncharacterized protein BU25DRAFT_234791 [Macroventuria anomochaeta]KAF2621587.1 hypothetical protein BU25DRAFT_234791 [Macroventuria anomochaeta]
MSQCQILRAHYTRQHVSATHGAPSSVAASPPGTTSPRRISPSALTSLPGPHLRVTPPWTIFSAKPDPEGKSLRSQQDTLASQQWKHIWVHWTCMPQDPRSKSEEAYLRNVCRHHTRLRVHIPLPAFRAKALEYDVAEFVLTCDESNFYKASDIQKFRRHIDEMVATSVQGVLK